MKSFSVWIPGRPAPQGSKRLGQAGQLLEQSPYLKAWRGYWTGKEGTPSRKYRHGAIGRAVYSEFARRQLAPEALPLFEGPVSVAMLFRLAGNPNDPPDLDKLARAVGDALTVCRVWVDDARVRRMSLDKIGIKPGDVMGEGCYVHVTPYEIVSAPGSAKVTIIRRKRLRKRMGVTW